MSVRFYILNPADQSFLRQEQLAEARVRQIVGTSIQFRVADPRAELLRALIEALDNKEPLWPKFGRV